jgi:hypothetical protein
MKFNMAAAVAIAPTEPNSASSCDSRFGGATQVTTGQAACVCQPATQKIRKPNRLMSGAILTLVLCGTFGFQIALTTVSAEELRRPETFAHHYAQLRDIRLHYVREGSGPPLILLHGWPGFWWEWHLNIGPLAKDFDVIVPDMRGYGDSEKPPLDKPRLFGVDNVVDDIDALMEQLQIKQAYLVGHDWAAIVIHKFVRKYPNRVIRAMIIDPIVPGTEVLYLSREHASEAWYFWFHQLDMAVALVGSSREATKVYYPKSGS